MSENGRRTLKTKSLLNDIAEGLSEGIPLRQLAVTLKFSKSAFYKWCNDDDELDGRIARARKEGFDAIAEECLEIADNSANDWMEREGELVRDAEHVSRSKLRIETRLKLLAKWSTKYADKQLIGGDKENPIAHTVVNADDVNSRIASLVARFAAAPDFGKSDN